MGDKKDLKSTLIAAHLTIFYALGTYSIKNIFPNVLPLGKLIRNTYCSNDMFRNITNKVKCAAPILLSLCFTRVIKERRI